MIFSRGRTVLQVGLEAIPREEDMDILKDDVQSMFH